MLNLQHYVVAAILLVIFITQTRTSAVNSGPCPSNMTSIGKFDMKRYLGKWYPYATYPMFKDKGRRCKSFEFVERKRSRYSIKQKYISKSTKTWKVKKYKILEVDSKRGTYERETNNIILFSSVDISILDTDYDNFAIEYLCIDVLDIFHFEWAGINYRQRVPSADNHFTATIMAQRAGIIISKLVHVAQDTCPPE